jgi:hypothetical protein
MQGRCADGPQGDGAVRGVVIERSRDGEGICAGDPVKLEETGKASEVAAPGDSSEEGRKAGIRLYLCGKVRIARSPLTVHY